MKKQKKPHQDQWQNMMKKYKFARHIEPHPDRVIPEPRKVTNLEKEEMYQNLLRASRLGKQKRARQKREWQKRVDREIIESLKPFLDD